MCAEFGYFKCDKGHEHQSHTEEGSGVSSFGMERFEVGSRYPVRRARFVSERGEFELVARWGKVRKIKCLWTDGHCEQEEEEW